VKNLMNNEMNLMDNEMNLMSNEINLGKLKMYTCVCRIYI
jgi:hypothetical protein